MVMKNCKLREGDATRGVHYACNTLAIVFARMLCVGQEEDIGFRQDRHEFHITPIAFRNRQLLEKPGEAEIEGGPPLPTGFLAQGIRQPGFAVLMIMPS
jgi:hypothetical protein